MPKYFVETCFTIYHTDVFECPEDEARHIIYGLNDNYIRHVLDDIEQMSARYDFHDESRFDWVDSGPIWRGGEDEPVTIEDMTGYYDKE